VRQTTYISTALGALLISILTVAQDTSSRDGELWGGDHIQLQILQTGGSLEFDCATGKITEPLRPNKTGAFTVQGTYSAEHAGPIRDDSDPTQKATYVGRIEGGTMELEIVLGKDAKIGPYTLVRNQSGNVRKCK
jgi:hypothetical protein